MMKELNTVMLSYCMCCNNDCISCMEMHAQAVIAEKFSLPKFCPVLLLVCRIVTLGELAS